MLFNESCKTGHLRVDTRSVKVVSGKRIVWTTPRSKITYSAPSCFGINGNPWCYNFSPGTLIYTPPSGFCNYFNCIPSFFGSDDPGDGYINKRDDGTYS